MVGVQKWFCTPGFADLIKNILLKYLHKRQMITFLNLYFTWHLSKVFKPNFSFSGSLCCITWAGVVLQKLSVATATAVDPSIRGQQTQVLTSPVVNAAQRELTFEEMRKLGKVSHTHLHPPDTQENTSLHRAHTHTHAPSSADRDIRLHECGNGSARTECIIQCDSI